LSEAESKQALAAYGIPNAREMVLEPAAIAALTESPIKFPLAVKIDSPDIPHKTEGGRSAAQRAKSRGTEKTRQQRSSPMPNATSPPRISTACWSPKWPPAPKVIIGVVNDKYFGPVVMFGLGGVFCRIAEGRDLPLRAVRRGNRA